MTAPVPTPMLDKAASEELTSSEIMQALRELTALDPDQRRFGVKVESSPVTRRMRAWMIVGYSVRFESHATIEMALRTERSDLLEIIAEIEAGA